MSEDVAPYNETAAARKNRLKKDADQRARFIEAAKKTGADESGKAFERAFKKIAPPVRTKKKS